MLKSGLNGRTGCKRYKKGCRPSVRYQKYYNKCNKWCDFNGLLPPATVLTAPLLNITKLSQEGAENPKNWVDAGEYGLVGYDENDELCILLDRGTAVFHSILTRQTVLHEMIHVYIGLDKGHGKLFKTQIRRIAALGALDNLI